MERPNAAFTSIQAAINAASPGDRINVCEGTYAEQLVLDKPGHQDHREQAERSRSSRFRVATA